MESRACSLTATATLSKEWVKGHIESAKSKPNTNKRKHLGRSGGKKKKKARSSEQNQSEQAKLEQGEPRQAELEQARLEQARLEQGAPDGGCGAAGLAGQQAVQLVVKWAQEANLAVQRKAFKAAIKAVQATMTAETSGGAGAPTKRPTKKAPACPVPVQPGLRSAVERGGQLMVDAAAVDPHSAEVLLRRMAGSTWVSKLATIGGESSGEPGAGSGAESESGAGESSAGSGAGSSAGSGDEHSGSCSGYADATAAIQTTNATATIRTTAPPSSTRGTKRQGRAPRDRSPGS